MALGRAEVRARLPCIVARGNIARRESTIIGINGKYISILHIIRWLAACKWGVK